MPSRRTASDHEIRTWASNIRAVHDLASPQTRKSGSNWYPAVHDAVAKGIRGSSLDMNRGAGIVAAVSPNMDWENNNIHALGEVRSLGTADWDHISKHANEASQHRARANQAKKSGDMAAYEVHKAYADASTVRAQEPLRGMSIHAANLGGMMKAKELLDGRTRDEVLPRKTAPKTNSFAINIEHPDEHGPVTIDGRAADISENTLRPWQKDRQISLGHFENPEHGMTKYEGMEQAHRIVADSLHREYGRPVLPHEVQAITWEQGKVMERTGLTASGQSRKKGPTRENQAYQGRPGALSSIQTLPGL